MKKKILEMESGKYYMLSNVAVTRTRYFRKKVEHRRFLKKIEEYLGGIAEIAAFYIVNNQFILIIKIKPRSEIEEFYKNKRKQKYSEDIEESDIPPNQYILSQQMSNLQNSHVRWCNHRWGRTGCNTAGRFKRRRIDENNVSRTIKKLHSRSFLHIYKDEYQPNPNYDSSEIIKENEIICNSYLLYQFERKIHPILKSYTPFLHLRC